MTARQDADQPMFGSDDPLSVVLEAIVRTVWLVGVCVWVLVRLAFTQPVPVILTALPVAAWFALA